MGGKTTLWVRICRPLGRGSRRWAGLPLWASRPSLVLPPWAEAAHLASSQLLPLSGSQFNERGQGSVDDLGSPPAPPVRQTSDGPARVWPWSPPAPTQEKGRAECGHWDQGPGHLPPDLSCPCPEAVEGSTATGQDRQDSWGPLTQDLVRGGCSVALSNFQSSKVASCLCQHQG